MNLDDYIKNTLISIGKGITDANESYEGPAPFKLLGGDNGTIDFEVFVSVEQDVSEKIKADTKATVLSIIKVAVSGTKDNIQKDSNKNLIRFKIKPDERTYYKIRGDL